MHRAVVNLDIVQLGDRRARCGPVDNREDAEYLPWAWAWSWEVWRGIRFCVATNPVRLQARSARQPSNGSVAIEMLHALL